MYHASENLKVRRPPYHWCLTAQEDRAQSEKDKQQMTNWKDRITSDPNVCHGKPCIKGNRVMVSVVIDNLAAGESHESIIRGYQIGDEDILAALRYAGDFARDRDRYRARPV